MANMHSYALRMASLVLVAALVFGAIAGVAIVRLQGVEDQQAGNPTLVADISDEPMTTIMVSDEVSPPPASAAPEPEAVVEEFQPDPLPEPEPEPQPLPAPTPEPAPELATEPDPNPASGPAPDLDPAALELTPAVQPSQDIFHQSFVGLTPEPQPEPEPAGAAREVPHWLELPGMTPSLEGLQGESIELALADPSAETPGDAPSPEAIAPEPEPQPEPEAIAAAPEENCDTASPDWAMFLYANSVPGNFARVPNVRVVPMGFCADTRQTLESRMQADGRLGSLRSAAAADQLVSLALGRASRGPSDVFAMATEGSVLNVYVY